ncbi:DUF6089 family protein [Phaeocystidibacter luteus]|uniref:DUF6089 domain-containing protein n=1 Tax=Phaeocystidibacter luteus TaxID=911197 RepID=A0A6N6RGF9_9FLAO|nr:DUF6089 family protein [Phaeocystidibacter luteus]KAB2809828.1 hypothetical protein F8C67_09755 [Phaeocystidibacter luteus]
MRKIFILSLLLSSVFALGQRALRYQEIQFSVGTMNYNGELTSGLNPGNILREMGFYGAVDYNHFFTPKFGMGLRVGYGYLMGDDANHDNPTRGLSFRSDIVEINGNMIYHFRRFGKRYQANRSTLYLKMSSGVAFSQASFPDDIQFGDGVTLYPGTNSAFNLGFGGGIKWRLTETSALSVEFMGHYYFSDVIEGFIIRDDTNGSDGYGGIRLGYSILIL